MENKNEKIKTDQMYINESNGNLRALQMNFKNET